MRDSEGRGDYSALYSAAFYCSLAMLVIIPLQIAVFALFPLPDSVAAWFELFASRPVVGLFHADLFILVNNILIAVIYLAFYRALEDTDKGLLQIALTLGFIGIAAYISSNRSFELWSLARAYATAATGAERTELLGAGRAMVAGWTGTAFDAYYVLNGVTLLIVSGLMFKGGEFGRVTAALGLAAGVLMVVPSTAGAVGLVFSLLSLIPWYAFTVRYAIVFRRLSRA